MTRKDVEMLKAALIPKDADYDKPCISPHNLEIVIEQLLLENNQDIKCANCQHWTAYKLSEDPIGWCAITCSGWMSYQFCSSFERSQNV